ncbi:hypothetical protein Srufu_051570 [Streptomyces libani subsp. rufus]|nr:hypothetical protein Srufu_051570 [Streptomyces libani subsp. rufus]
MRAPGDRSARGSAYGPERTRVRTVNGSPSKARRAPRATARSAGPLAPVGSWAFTCNAAAGAARVRSACRSPASPIAPEKAASVVSTVVVSSTESRAAAGSRRCARTRRKTKPDTDPPYRAQHHTDERMVADARRGRRRLWKTLAGS